MTTKYESYEGHAQSANWCFGTTHQAQTFKPQATHQLKSIFLWMYRIGSPGDCLIQIFLADANHKPTGAAIGAGSVSANGWTASTTGARYEIPLTQQPLVQIDTEYVIDITCQGASSSNCIAPRGYASGDVYARGVEVYTTSYPTGWAVTPTTDLYFEEWGDLYIAPPTVATNAATDVGYHQATLHGTLTSDGGAVCQVRFNYGLTNAYGTNTDWQTGKVTGNIFEQTIIGLQDEKTYYLRSEANNSAGTSYGAETQLTTPVEPPAEGKHVKALVRHPALKQVRVIAEGEEIANYDQLSDPDEQRIETALEIPCPTPCTIEVTTLADQVFSYNIPLKS